MSNSFAFGGTNAVLIARNPVARLWIVEPECASSAACIVGKAIPMTISVT